mmetsp:Transcript_99131/g.171930  ORF Transcript_99131/g.171930 Transcript_99131/m.171930 type:complete len:204 (+) Transcript_99131:553-1164(+)
MIADNSAMVPTPTGRHLWRSSTMWWVYLLVIHTASFCARMVLSGLLVQMTLASLVTRAHCRATNPARRLWTTCSASSQAATRACLCAATARFGLPDKLMTHWDVTRVPIGRGLPPSKSPTAWSYLAMPKNCSSAPRCTAPTSASRCNLATRKVSRTWLGWATFIEVLVLLLLRGSAGCCGLHSSLWRSSAHLALARQGMVRRV